MDTEKIKCPKCGALFNELNFVTNIILPLEIKENRKTGRPKIKAWSDKDIFNNIVNDDHQVILCTSCFSAFKAKINENNEVVVGEEYIPTTTDNKGKTKDDIN